MPAKTEPASQDQWTLVRNARQLLTLYGASGPRRGPAMADLNIVPHGAVLIRNGLIEDTGPARRVENLAGAKRAREIDATGRVVMPAFVDADMPLVVPEPDSSEGLRLMSRRRVHARAAAAGAEWARYGCLTVGARTPWATDMQNIRKVLTTHKELQSKPLRIRSIFAPGIPSGGDRSAAGMFEALTAKWLQAVRSKKLASILELTVGGAFTPLDIPTLRSAAIAAAALGFAIRLRSAARFDAAGLELALAAGAVAIVAPNDSLHSFTLHNFVGPLAAMGCVRVIPASEALDDSGNAAGEMRRALDEGSAIALASNYRAADAASYNMQFLLHLAVYRLGMTVEEAITALTWNGACSLRLSHKTGSLEPGKAADLLVFDVDDYRDLPRRAGHHDLALAVRAGHVVFRSAPLIQD